jgi:hypothetical protein
MRNLGVVFLAYLDEENHKKVIVDITKNFTVASHSCNEANSLTLPFVIHFYNVCTFISLLHETKVHSNLILAL